MCHHANVVLIIVPRAASGSHELFTPQCLSCHFVPQSDRGMPPNRPAPLNSLTSRHRLKRYPHRQHYFRRIRFQGSPRGTRRQAAWFPRPCIYHNPVPPSMVASSLSLFVHNLPNTTVIIYKQMNDKRAKHRFALMTLYTPVVCVGDFLPCTSAQTIAALPQLRDLSPLFWLLVCAMFSSNRTGSQATRKRS